MLPGFNASGVLPPFVGENPGMEPNLASPYETTMRSFSEQFGQSAPRRDILRRLLAYRQALRAVGITTGFQMFDGSFIEDCERLRSRPPSDLDVVTFSHLPVAAMAQGSLAGVDFGYDAMGRRVTRGQWAGSPSNARSYTLYAYDQQHRLLGEYGADGAPITEYVWLGDTPVAVIKPDGTGFQVYAIHTDHLDTPRMLLDANSQVRWRWLGEPFGASPAEEQPTTGLAAVQQSLRFPGQQYEAFGGRHYNHFRDYDPTTGRYVQSDPIGLAGGLNTYAYVGGNPLSGIDPNGLARIVGAPAYGPNFGKPSKEYQEWQTRFGQPMQRILDAVENRIRGLCQIDRGRLQKEFDEWVVTADPNIDNPARRIQQGYGITKGNKTTFSRRFFMIEPGESPSQLHVGWHEFRHTMPGNASIVDPPGSIGDILSGNAGRVPSEIDADAFADWLINSSKTCGCPK